MVHDNPAKGFEFLHLSPRPRRLESDAPVSGSIIPLDAKLTAKLKRLATQAGKSPVDFVADWLREQPEPPSAVHSGLITRI